MAYLKTISVYDPPARIVDYILRTEKVATLKVDGTAHRNLTTELLTDAKYNIETATDRLINYITDDKKTEEKFFVSAQNCNAATASEDFTAAQLLRKSKAYNYTKGKREVKQHHVIQAFYLHECSPEVAHRIAQETAHKHFGPDAQILIATHVDGKSIHNHLLVNSVDIRGNKIISNKEALWKMRNISDDICRAHNLSIIKDSRDKKTYWRSYKNWKEANPALAEAYNKQRRNVAWHDDVRTDIDKAIIASNSYDEFIAQLEKHNYEVKDSGRMYLSIRKKGFSKPVRTGTLGEDYTRERIKERIADPEKHFVKDNKSEEKIPLKTFIGSSSNRFMAQRAFLMLAYLPVIEILFRLIVNNVFTKAIKFDMRNPYGILNDYHFVRYMAQLKYLENNNLRTREDFFAHRKRKYQTRSFLDGEESILRDIDDTIAGFDEANVRTSDAISIGPDAHGRDGGKTNERKKTLGTQIK